MAQTLLIGLGGTGSRVVNRTAELLRKNGSSINNGEMCCAVLDTNENDYKAIRNSRTGVPVIPTSKPQKICDYFAEYHHLHMETWCPQTPAFMDDSMVDGAAELRMKSRIAFMDTVESGELDNTLGRMINDVLKNNAGSKIRVMIVSSLSGGTGSGMFIQVALWLRKFLKESQITIRGIFLLPDVFISTIDDIRKNKETASRHYCNAYAAIRELNAISKIRKNNGLDLPEKITLGDLFDSLRDKDSGKPVFDFAFFVDDENENGVRFDEIKDYENLVAQLVYMQMYAPMRDNMYSEEDNTFLSFISNDEPLYGSCGTAKAVYPATEVKEYCTIRAAQDSLTEGWAKLDNEVIARGKEIQQAKDEGYGQGESFEPRQEYMRLFKEKTSVKPEDAGRDRFFLSIAQDIMETEKNAQYDKVDRFIDFLEKEEIDKVATKHDGLNAYDKRNEGDSTFADMDAEALRSAIQHEESEIKKKLELFENNAEEYANSIVNSVFPYSMGDVNPNNRRSCYGLLTKPNIKGGWDFIHPVAAKYVLYRLADELKKRLTTGLITSKEKALAGGQVEKELDNPATSDTETTPIELIDSMVWWQKLIEELFLDDVKKRYISFMNVKVKLCRAYDTGYLQMLVYRKLLSRVEALIAKLEAFFSSLDAIKEKLTDELAKNIRKNSSADETTIFVYGSVEDKEAVYQSLALDNGQSNVQINKSVIDAVYGSLCAEKRDNIPENKAYLNMSIRAAFLMDILGAYNKQIEENTQSREAIYMDIYTALCKATDRDFRARGGRDDEDDLKNLDIESGIIDTNGAKNRRYAEALKELKKDLNKKAAPFLIHEQERSDNALGTITTRKKIFWGFSPAVLAACPTIGAELGVNADLQMDAAYPGNELYCYRAVYGLEATYIPNFNELKGGKYYTCYKAVIDKMVQEAEGVKGERALVVTPHLDKNWHRILPYITGDKQKQEELAFFRGFWLALAYGVIRIDKNGNFCIRRNIDSGFGNAISEDIPVLYKNKSLGKTDVAKLIEVLKQDKVFTDTEIPRLEAEFEEELEEMTTYVGTRVLQGLTTKRDELNAASVAVRYHESRKREKTVASSLVGSLEQIAGQLAECYNMSRSDKQLEEAKFRICRKIYDSSKRSKDKAEIFGNWVAAFEKYKIAEDNSAK